MMMDPRPLAGDVAPCSTFRCRLLGGANDSSTMAASVATGFLGLSPWKRNLLILTAFLLVGVLSLGYLMHHQKGIRRIYQFWSRVMPWIVEYHWLQFKLHRIDRSSPDVIEERLHQFHNRTAHRAVDLVQRMGGIYVKMGQVASTVGVGILQDDYIQALRPLQDGIPPRSLPEMSRIFHDSTGQPMDQALEWVDEKPIGAASIAQAHLAALKKRSPTDPDDVVVVKIQYPEVAELFEADLTNMDIAARLLLPGSRDMVRALRERHSRELDFRQEARHLRECAANLQRHRPVERLVRIPRVRNETGLCTQHVLVMEYLEGTSLNAAIEQEQDRMAHALGQRDGKALREFVLERISEHLEQTHANATETDYDERPNRWQQLATSDWGAGVFRAYVNLRDRIDSIREGWMDRWQPTSRRREERPKRQRLPVSMRHIMKTLIQVHGLQLLKDGVYNADPHPGNVVVMKDGRLGLLDYGMVGRVTPEQRRNIAKTILALGRKDGPAVNEIYREAGYRATWKEGSVYDDPEIVRRFATFHFDKFDLSPVTLGPTTKTSTGNDFPTTGGKDMSDSLGKRTSAQATKQLTVLPPGKRRTLKMLDILATTQEWSVPDWVEQGRRLTGLLSGVSLQAGHPMSIAKEWHSIAGEVLEEFQAEEEME